MIVDKDFDLFTDIVKCAWKTLRSEQTALISILGVPVAISMLCNMPGIAGTNTVLSLIISAACYIWLAVATHRIVLKGSDSISGQFPFSWSKREVKFSLYTLGLLVLLFSTIIIIGFPLGLLGDQSSVSSRVGGVFMLLLVLYLYARCCLVFPAIAIDFDMSFTNSWEATVEYKWVMMYAVGLVPIAIGLPAAFLGSAIMEGILYPLTLVLEIAVLSAAFRHIILSEARDE